MQSWLSLSPQMQRDLQGYRKTGDLLTLNYTDVELAINHMQLE